MKASILVGVFCATLLYATSARAVTIPTLPVGNPGNPPDSFDVGSVGYNYRIGQHEVTNAQYLEFLNGVDPTGANTLALYNSNMTTDARGGIIFNSGAANGAKYSIKSGRDNNPVVFVSWYDTIRFANWLHNGQGNGDTENGAYMLLGGTPSPSNGNSVTRNASATWFLPSEHEWYKAAYHKNDGVTQHYWDFPTATNVMPYSYKPPGSAAPDPANTANIFKIWYAVTGFASFNNAQNYLTDVGAYTSARSPYGTFDQGGNVWEWNEALYGTNFRSRRGGSWSGDSNGLLAGNRYSFISPTNENYSTGFRVANIPEPASIALCLAGVTMLALTTARRKRAKVVLPNRSPGRIVTIADKAYFGMS